MRVVRVFRELRCATCTAEKGTRAGGPLNERGWLWVTTCGSQGSAEGLYLGGGFWHVFIACCDVLLWVLFKSRAMTTVLFWLKFC